MNEITHGPRSLLSYSWVYDLFQKTVGKKNAREIFSATYIKAQPGNCVLDIGCGTAQWRSYLPEAIEYCGFDPNPHYIKSAKAYFKNVPGCTFLCASIDDVSLDLRQKFDIALALGVLHHLNDNMVIKLAKLVRSALKDGGRLILVDPCFFEGQSFIARRIIMLDRGQHVRDVNDYRKLLASVFGAIHCEIRYNSLKIPYSHVITECRDK